MDKSGGSKRTMINLVNVRKPQSLTHLKLLGSFDGAKDLYADLVRNFKKWFDNRLEPLMNRLITSIVIEIDNNFRTKIFLNGYGRARFDSPTSLPKSSGICNDADIYNIDNQYEGFYICLNFNKVVKTELTCLSNKVVGIICKNSENICTGMETFDGSTCTKPDISNIMIKQYCIF